MNGDSPALRASTSPAVIYFPPGTYKVSTPIEALYQSQLIGDARHPPTLLAAPNFAGFAVIGQFAEFVTYSAILQ